MAGRKEFSTPLSDFNQGQLDQIESLATSLVDSMALIMTTMFTKEGYSPFSNVGLYQSSLAGEYQSIVEVEGKGYIRKIVIGSAGIGYDSHLRISLDGEVFFEGKTNTSGSENVCTGICLLDDLQFITSAWVTSLPVVGGFGYGKIENILSFPYEGPIINKVIVIPEVISFRESLLVEMKRGDTSSNIPYACFGGVAG